MNILVFNWRDIKHPEAGGAEVYLHEIAAGCVRKGHSVTIVSSKFPGSIPEETIDGIRHIRKGGKYTFLFVPICDYFFKLKEYRPDIIIESISKLPHLMPLIVRKPYMAIIHHIHGHTLFKELPLPAALLAYIIERLIPWFYRKSGFVTVSPSTQKELISMGIPERNITLIYNGIDQRLFEGTSDVQKSAKPLIIYMGRVKRYKAIDHLIEAFDIVVKQVPDAELIIAGKGDAYDELEQLVKQKGLRSVTFKPQTTDDEKVQIMKKAWVYVSTSTKEGWGITVIESNASGTPVIGYDVPGIRDSIRDGETGLLVSPAGDIEKLAQTILRILNDRELRNGLSEKAVEWSRNFTWENSTDGFSTLLDGIAAKHYIKDTDTKNSQG